MNKLNLLLGGNLVLVLGVVNWITQDKEDLLQNGRVVLLEVGKYDPRSLMQGDYMALRYLISRTILQRLGEAHQSPGTVRQPVFIIENKPEGFGNTDGGDGQVVLSQSKGWNSN